MHDEGWVYGGEKRLELLGDLDELNSFIGFAKCFVNEDECLSILTSIQNSLFLIQTEIGKPKEVISSPRKIEEQDVISLEQQTAHFEEELGTLEHFISPAGVPFAAALQYARTLARRVERKVVYYADIRRDFRLNPFIAQYLDRLACLLFHFARFVNKKNGWEEQAPTYYQEIKEEGASHG